MVNIKNEEKTKPSVKELGIRNQSVQRILLCNLKVFFLHVKIYMHDVPGDNIFTSASP